MLELALQLFAQVGETLEVLPRAADAVLGVATEGDPWYDVVGNPEFGGEGGRVYVSGAGGA
jgi:hypothetical protein